MAIKTVTLEQAPARMHGRVSSNVDYQAVMGALSNAATNPVKMKCAIVVDMEDLVWGKRNEKGEALYPKPEVTFAYTLRRYFEANALPLTAYQSGKMQVTIRQKLPNDPKGKGGRKAK
jgi:hypothetical protein